MILFLNFAPIEFMGGSERWMLEVCKKVNTKEKVILIDVAEKIASLYGQIVLKRKFLSPIKTKNRIAEFDRITLTVSSFIPYTKSWKKAKSAFSNSRLIYTRFELLEILLCIYFGGVKVLSKTIAGIVLSIKYQRAESITQKLHNIIYSSYFYISLLRRTNKIHVLNKRDEMYLKSNLNLSRVMYMPLGTKISSRYAHPQTLSKNNELDVIYVGELSARKGTDTLCKIINHSPNNFVFHIVGNGPMKNSLIDSISANKNAYYHGYISDTKLKQLYSKCDVILFPSRAEAFGLVMIEAASYGLKIVSSAEVSLGLPSEIETTAHNREATSYIYHLNIILKEKLKNKINRKKISEYISLNFSDSVINSLFMKKILEIKI